MCDSVDECQWPMVSSLSPAIFRGHVGFFALETIYLFLECQWPMVSSTTSVMALLR
jgi:hypothetical protein